MCYYGIFVHIQYKMKTLLQLILIALLLYGCNNDKEKNLSEENESLKKQLDSIKRINSIKIEDKKLSGVYKNQEKGIYKSFDFKGETSVVITDGIIGLPYATSYVKDGDIIRIKTDKSDLLLTIIDNSTLKGEAFAIGNYIKE